MAAFQKGEWDEAAAAFETLIETNPDWAPGRVILGQTCFLLGRPDEGRRQLDRAKQIDPGTDLFVAYAAAGQELVKRERYGEAAGAFEGALENAPEDRARSMSRQLSDAWLRAGRYGEARRVLERHLRRYGADPRVSFHLALACRRLDDYDCAVQQLQDAQRSGEDPSGGKLPEYLAQWSYARALLPEKEDRRDELLVDALEATRAWLGAAPDDPDARRYLGETLLALGRTDEAIDKFRPIAERSPSDCTAPLMVARAENVRGNGEQAEWFARRAVECAPGNGDAHAELAAALLRQVHPEQKSLERVRADLELAREALSALDEAQRLRSDARTKGLRARTAETVARLEAAESEFEQIEIDFTMDWAAAKDREITERCLAIYWERRDGARAVSAEDDAFWRRNDCRRRVQQRGVGPS